MPAIFVPVMATDPIPPSEMNPIHDLSVPASGGANTAFAGFGEAAFEYWPDIEHRLRRSQPLLEVPDAAD